MSYNCSHSTSSFGFIVISVGAFSSASASFCSEMEGAGSNATYKFKVLDSVMNSDSVFSLIKGFGIFKVRWYNLWEMSIYWSAVVIFKNRAN